jgi:hypothetical protein
MRNLKTLEQVFAEGVSVQINDQPAYIVGGSSRDAERFARQIRRDRSLRCRPIDRRSAGARSEG